MCLMSRKSQVQSLAKRLHENLFQNCNIFVAPNLGINMSHIMIKPGFRNINNKGIDQPVCLHISRDKMFKCACEIHTQYMCSVFIR